MGTKTKICRLFRVRRCVKKESPYMGTKTPIDSIFRGFLGNVKKESPYMGTKTYASSVGLSQALIVKKESPYMGTKTLLVFR